MKSLDIQSNIEAFSFAAYLSFLPRLTRKRQEKSTKIEEEGESSFYDALTTSYITDVNEITVKECETMPTSYFYNSELKKVGTYYSANYNREDPGISPKGLVVYQHNTDLVNVFAIEVTKSERFDTSKLYITNGGNTIIYDNNHYNVVAYSGDEEGSLKVYKNGKLLNI